MRGFNKIYEVKNLEPRKKGKRKLTNAYILDVTRYFY